MNDLLSGLGGRREAREDALAVLYESAMADETAAFALDRREPAPAPYTSELVVGVDAKQAELDEILDRHLKNWSLDRMAMVDHLLARMAAWELIYRDDIPTGAALSELVELATQYGGVDSAKFLNGLLRAVADEVRSDSDEAEIAPDEAAPES